MTTYLGTITVFDHKISEWLIYKGKLTQFLKINSVEEEKKSGILLTHLTEETYRLVLNLAFPKELETLTYSELVELLDGHFKPKKCSFADKAKFFGATRKSDETLGEWAARIRGLAVYCDFGSALETNLRDRFVLGLNAGPERDKLFEQSPSALTLARAIEMAEQAACAKEAKVMLNSGVTSDVSLVKEEPIYRAGFPDKTGRGRGGGSGSGSGSRSGSGSGSVGAGASGNGAGARCAVCGLKNHNSDKCRYKGYKCLKCGHKGHLKKVCAAKDSCVYHVKTDQKCSDQDAGCEECQNFNLRYDKPIQIDLILGNCRILMELDSGSGGSVISDRLYRDKFSQYPLEQCNIKMCLYDGHKISPLGVFAIEAFYNKVKKMIKIFVIENGGPPLLGRNFMSAFNLVLTSSLNSLQNKVGFDTDLLLGKFPNLWRDELGSFNRFKVKLQVKEHSVPKYFKPRSVPFALKDKVEKELQRLVDAGILISVDHSEYATPIVPVLKENGSVRIAGDFSVTLNRDLIIEKYPLPRIEEVFAKIGGGEMYSKIDLKNAYNQFILEDSSQPLTTISTHKGLYMYTRLVYGLANAPAIFQKSMEILLAGIDGVSVWLDDICITGPDRKSHIGRLHEVLRRLNDAGLRLQKDKCAFFKNSVTYLGYVISKSGLMTNPDKVKAIMSAPEPTNVTEVKRFVGIVNYYRNFIPNASSLLSPLHELLCKDAVWVWTDRQRNAMAAVRRELASERVLAHFEPRAQLVLTVDAGPTGLGAVLAQQAPDGQERPLAYASRSLASNERNYSQIQKEATAIIFGVKRFHQYLYGRSEPFILRTDHRPLVSIFNNKTGIPVTTALRLQRYAIILSAYNYVVQYVAGDKNLVADYFSRAPLACKNEVNESDIDTYYTLRFLDEASPAITTRDVTRATASDKTIQTVVRYLRSGWPRKINCTSVLPYFQCKSDLQFENGCLFRGHRIVIPQSLRQIMLRELHDTHLGIIKTKSNARGRMWWPGIDNDIERWIGGCETCVSVRAAPPRSPSAPWPSAGAPWQRLHIDYMTVGQRVYLVVVDSFSKWLECLHMHNGLSSKALISKLKAIFSTFGIPNVIISDNDAKINSLEFKTFCSSNGIKYMTTPIYHPPSNGQAENSVRICKKMLKCVIRDNLSLCQINELLLGYLFNYRNTVHCTTGETPAKLMFGRTLRSRLDLIMPSDDSNKLAPNSDIGKRHFSISDIVWVRWYNARKESWQLGTVTKKIGNRMYKIKIHDFHIECIRHVDQIFKYRGSNDRLLSDWGTGVSHHAQPSAESTSSAIDSEPVMGNPYSQTAVDTPAVENVESRVTIEEKDGDNCSHYQAEECERGIDKETSTWVSPSAAQPGMAGPATASEQASDTAVAALSPVHERPVPSPTLTRQTSKRVRKIIDYKKYF